MKPTGLRETANRRPEGFTLLELSIASAVIMVLMGSVGAVFTAMTAGTSEVAAALLAQNQAHRARRALLEDLQMCDTVSADTNGNPYYQVLSEGAGTDNKLVFRKVEGYEVLPGDDRVTPTFGTPVTYYVDATGRLVREQDGTPTVIAAHVGGVTFGVSTRGIITIRLDLLSKNRHGDPQEVSHQVRIVPRNSMTI